MVAPALSILVVFVIGPLLCAAVLSLTSWNIVGPVRWTGLANYRLAAADPKFSLSLVNTAVYTAASTVVGLTGALSIALLLDRKLPGIGAFRALLFLPALVSEVVSAMVFQWILNPDLGAANALLVRAHLPPVPWLTSPTWSMVSVVLLGAWVGAAYNAPVLLAGLRSIPAALHEAARLDGASRWQELVWITLPSLRPFVLYVVVMSVIGSFQVFGRIHVLTGGGPVDSTLVTVGYIYRVAFTFNQMGYACALAVIVFALLAGATYTQMRLVREEPS
jgi:ABC-type sugar transport system permease subunit